MKICTFFRRYDLGYIKKMGFFFNDHTIVDANAIWIHHFHKQGFYQCEVRANHKCPTSLHHLLKINDNPIAFLKETFDKFIQFSEAGDLKTINDTYLSFDLRDDKKIELAAPLDKIETYRDFYIHEKHVKKGFEKRNEPVPPAWYEMPVYYKGSTVGFIGPNQDILWPSYTQKLDFELELACVLARDGFNIKEKDAYRHILGYTILNDISARDIQKKEMSVRLGPAKGKDFCSVIGPVITTADEFNFEEPKLNMTASINGKIWSQGKSNDGHYTWAQILAHASKDEWLLAGDLFGSGTVGTGCGLELDRWIQPGDIVELEVEKIGKLKNMVGTPSKDL